MDSLWTEAGAGSVELGQVAAYLSMGDIEFVAYEGVVHLNLLLLRIMEVPIVLP